MTDDSTDQQQSRAPYPPPRPPLPPAPTNASGGGGGVKGSSPFYSISDNSTGAGGSTSNTKGPSPVPRKSGDESRTPSRAELYNKNINQNVSGSMEEATGMRRRRNQDVPCNREASPDHPSSSSMSRQSEGGEGSERSATATPGGGSAVLNAVARGMLGVSKWTLGSVANQLGGPFGWGEFMFAWVSDITPPRLKRLATIFWDAGAHITKLAYTEGGNELGFAARNVIDGLVETVAAPKGRALVLESGMTFVKLAEAVDTPEMHAAITQGFKLGTRGLEVLATGRLWWSGCGGGVCVRVCPPPCQLVAMYA